MASEADGEATVKDLGEDDEDEYEGFECSRCAAEVEERDRFCWSCGRRLDPLAGCGACGAEIQAADRFCRQCGSPLEQSQEKPELDQLLARAHKDVLPFITGDDAKRVKELCGEAEEAPSASILAELRNVLERYKYL